MLLAFGHLVAEHIVRLFVLGVNFIHAHVQSKYSSPRAIAPLIFDAEFYPR